MQLEGTMLPDIRTSSDIYFVPQSSGGYTNSDTGFHVNDTNKKSRDQMSYKNYSAEFKEKSLSRALSSDNLIPQTANELLQQVSDHTIAR